MKRLAFAAVALASCAALPVAADRTEPVEPEKPAVDIDVPTPAFNPNTIPDVAERAVKSVVNVATTQKVAVQSQMAPFSNDPFFRQFFGDPRLQQPREQIRQGQGSGVVIDAERGLVVTNNHVVDHADEVEVAFSDGETHVATVLGTDPKTDLAVLKLDPVPDGLVALEVGDSDALRLGETVLAVGNPFGVGHSVTMGIVSATGRANMGIVDYEDFIQTDAAINPGNSGGALVNLRGELVGINTAIVSRSGGYQGIGFAIPTEMMQPIVDSLIDDGTVQRGYLGVMIQDLDEGMAAALELGEERGILVSDVTDDAPAGKAGFRTGDVIVELGGEAVDSVSRFRSRIATMGPDTPFEIGVVRNGKRKTLKGKLGLLPGSETADAATETDDALGLTLESLTAAARSTHAVPKRIDGVLVAGVEPGSLAARTGIRAGDVLTEVNRRPVRTPSDVTEALADSKRALLLLYRDGYTRFVVVDR